MDRPHSQMCRNLMARNNAVMISLLWAFSEKLKSPMRDRRFGVIKALRTELLKELRDV